MSEKDSFSKVKVYVKAIATSYNQNYQLMENFRQNGSQVLGRIGSS